MSHLILSFIFFMFEVSTVHDIIIGIARQTCLVDSHMSLPLQFDLQVLLV